MSHLPQRRGELLQARSSDGWTIYEPENDSLHMLNETAKAIWDLCDGRTSAKEMAAAVSELTGLSIEHAEAEVMSALGRLEQAGLIETG